MSPPPFRYNHRPPTPLHPTPHLTSRHLSPHRHPSVNKYHMPIIRDMFIDAKKSYDAEYIGYINSDVLLSPDLAKVLRDVKRYSEQGSIAKQVRMR